jgi:hypothetical protein
VSWWPSESLIRLDIVETHASNGSFEVVGRLQGRQTAVALATELR